MAQQTLADKPVVKTKAHEMAQTQREIGVAEFFAKNRHLLGFDNKRKALMTTIKEAVDNALDACEEAKILPELIVEVIDMENDRFKVIIEDNGPGIPKEIQSKIFDAFFSTKGVGKGTGLGLNISYSIVVQKHRGDLRVKSEPRQTIFEVWLPINFEQ